MTPSERASNARGWRAGALCCLLVPGLAAAASSLRGAEDKVCVGGVVDKDKLAAFLIDKHPLSMQVYTAHPELAPSAPLSKTIGALLRDRKACKDKCGSNDQANLEQIRIEATLLLQGSVPAYGASATAEADRYFSGAQDQDPVTCGPYQARKNEPAQGTKSKAAPAWRVRGDPAKLFIDQGSAQFKSVDTAVLSLSRDEVADTRTSRVFGYLGYRLPLGGNDGMRSTDIIPYLGVNRNRVRIHGSMSNDDSSDTVDAGVIAYLFRTHGSVDRTGIGHVVSVGADYLADRLDGSRLVSLNLEYQPVTTNAINGVVEWHGLSIFPTLALRVKAGHYSRRAEGAAADAQENFTRAGVALGLGFANDDDASLPLEFNNSYVGLASSGGKAAVSHFKHSLTWNLDHRHRFGLSLNYEHGRREDTLKYVRLWEMALSVRY